MFERPVQWAASFLNRDVDATAFRWLPTDGVGTITAFFGRSVVVLQNGIVRSYALVFAVGIAGFLLFLLVRGT
jgi:NADH:ubiquinone oxidoreductase subunit 5 (subunit L)/multisubunit Na+/H+ antiporter MnhA subunit